MQTCKWFDRSPRHASQPIILFSLLLVFLVRCTYAAGREWFSVGPEGGEISTIAVDPQNPAVVYAGTYSGRLFKSTNSGDSWYVSDKGLRIANLLYPFPVTSLAIAPGSPRTLYLGSYYGVFKSQDSGATWSAVLGFYVVLAVVIDPVNPSTIYAGTYSNGILKSTNGGGTWENIVQGLPSTYVRSLAINQQNSSIIYIGIEGEGGGVYKSIDAGAHWSVTGLQTDIRTVVIDPLYPSIVYALSSSYTTSGSGIYKSTDDGAHWIELAKSQAVVPRNPTALAIDPQMHDVLYAGTYSGSYRSNDGGATWVSLAPNLNFRCLVINPQNASIVYAGTTAGFYKNAGSGVTWIPSNTGLAAHTINDVALNSQNSAILYATTNAEILKTTDGGAAWKSIGPFVAAGSYYLEIDPQNPDTIYGSYGLLMKSTNGGVSWTFLSPPASTRCLAIDPQNSQILYGGTYDKGVIKSTNGGMSWSTAVSGSPTSSVYVLAVDPKNAETVFAGTMQQGVFKSTDGGANWAVAGNGIPPNTGIISMAINPQNPAMLYAGSTGYGLFTSTDGGASWNSSNGRMGDIYVEALAINPQNPANVFAGAVGEGVFRSTDGGTSWSAFSDGLSTGFITTLAIDPGGAKIYAGTVNSVWIHSLIGSSINLTLNAGGASTANTIGGSSIRTGYAGVSVNSASAPYGTAVFSFRQNGVTVSEAAVPSSPPTTRARVFIDYRAAANPIPGRNNAGTVKTNVGIAVVNYGSAVANVTYTLRDLYGNIITIGHGTLEAGHHFACFIDSLKNVAAPDFNLPIDFQVMTLLGSLDIEGDQPLSVLALRGVTNQRNEFIVTTTPVADLTQPLLSNSINFPHFVDGGGYTTSLILMNTSAATETGSFQIMNKDGNTLTVNQAGGGAGSSFSYSIPPGGLLFFQTDGSPADTNVGWVRLKPDYGTHSPVGSGIFSCNPADVLVSESGISSAAATLHARIYVDLSGDHNTGLAIANTGHSDSVIKINAYKKDGITAVGTSQGPLILPGNGHSAEFADRYVTGLPEGFTGVLDIASTTPFAALTLRSLVNERDEFLMTAFPVADLIRVAPSPIVFPHIADGGGYTTEFILLSAGGGASITLRLFDETGQPMDF